MPQNFEKILKGIRLKLKGTKNPKTKKTYSNSESYNMAISAYKKKYGTAPTKEESPKWYFDGSKEIREDVKLNWANVIEYEKGKKTSIDAPLVIKGRAINETITSNRVKYINEELDMAAPSLIGKPILNSHNHEDVRETLGVIIGSEKVAGGLDYIAEIDPDERKIINKIKRGYISKVSICADCKTLEKEQVTEGDKVIDVYVARGMTFKELSLVTVPGDKNSSINVSNAISESFNFNINESENDLITDIISEKLDNTEDSNTLLSEKNEENKMSEELQSKKIIEMEAQLATILKEKEEMSSQLKVIEQEKAEKAKEESLKNLISEAVKKELQQIKSVKVTESDEEVADSEEKGKVNDEDVEKIEEKLGNAYSNLIIEKAANGTSFYYMPKEASSKDNIFKRWMKNELR